MTTLTVVGDDTGHLEPGTAARHVLPGAVIIKASVGPMDNDVYLVTCSRSGETLLIDAADDAPALRGLVEAWAPTVSLIVTTHAHPDHWRALTDVAAATGAPTAAHPVDGAALPIPPDRALAHGDTVTIGDLEFDVIHLRGHTEGSVALALRPTADGAPVHLFTGDSLFPGGVGKTWRDGDFERLLDDVTARIFDVYDDATVVHPGHGDDTTLGAEREQLPRWRERGW